MAAIRSGFATEYRRYSEGAYAEAEAEAEAEARRAGRGAWAKPASSQ